MIDPMASALERLGVTSLIIANAKDGLDEISPNTPTLVQSRIDGKTTLAVLNPREFGVPDGFIANLSSGDTVEESAAILTSALDGSEESRWWALIPNAAAALYLVGHATDMRTGAVMAREAIRSGAAVEKLRELVAASNSV
ncbi:MAG: hypothetical protein K8R88_14125 [Armatimonadetes bacterium]|nr:hypothetical protein [Armatimonadota bacterium]